MKLLTANSEIEHFLRNVQIPADIDKCWEWAGKRFPDLRGMKRYGVFTYQGKRTNAHRIFYQMLQGQVLPQDIIVRHCCDNPICVNPSHLTTGTHKQNMEDMVARGRQSKGERHQQIMKGVTQRTWEAGRGFSQEAIERMRIRMKTNNPMKNPDNVAKARVKISGDNHYSRRRPDAVRRGDACGKNLGNNYDLIFKLRADGIKQKEIGKLVGLSQPQVSKILLGHSRKYQHAEPYQPLLWAE